MKKVDAAAPLFVPARVIGNQPDAFASHELTRIREEHGNSGRNLRTVSSGEREAGETESEQQFSHGGIQWQSGDGDSVHQWRSNG